MKVAQVIGVHQGHGPGRLDLRISEHRTVQAGPLDDPDASQRGDPRAVPTLAGAQHRRHPLAVTAAEFFDDPAGQGVISAHDQMVALVAQATGDLGHGAI